MTARGRSSMTPWPWAGDKVGIENTVDRWICLTESFVDMAPWFSQAVVVYFYRLFTRTNLCPFLCCGTARALGRWSVCAGRQWPHPGPESRWSPRWWRTRTATGLCETGGTRCGWGWCPCPEGKQKSRQPDFRLTALCKAVACCCGEATIAWPTTRGRYSTEYCDLSRTLCCNAVKVAVEIRHSGLSQQQTSKNKFTNNLHLHRPLF